MIVGVILGYSPEGGVEGVIAAMALVVLFAFGLAWVFTTVGLVMRSPNAVMNTGFMALFPLLFISNAFVPPETLPSAIEAFVDVNPFSTGDRGPRPDGRHGRGRRHLLVLGEAAVVTAVFAPLTLRLYRTRA